MYESDTSKFPGVTWRLVFVTIFLSLGIHSPTYILLLRNNFYYSTKLSYNSTNHDRPLSNSEYAWLYSTPYGIFCISAIFGSSMMKIVADLKYFGRKSGLLIHSILSIIGIVCFTISSLYSNITTIIAGPLICGFAIGLGEGMTALFLSEIAPPKFRGAICASFQVGAGFISTLALVLGLPKVLGTGNLEAIAIGLGLVPALIQVMVLIWAYDSPRHLLISNAKPDLSDRAIEFFQGPTRISVVKRELNLESVRESENVYKFRNLLTRETLLVPLLLSLILHLLATFSGGLVFLFFSQAIFIDIGLGATISEYSTVAVGICLILPALLSVILVERVGRRYLLLTGIITSFLSLSVGTILLAGHKHSNWNSDGVKYSILVMALFTVIGSSFILSMAFTISPELFPQTARSSALGVISSWTWIFRFLQLFFFLPLMSAIGIDFVFIINLVITLFSALILVLYLPETKGRTFLEISRSFSPRFRKASKRKISVIYNFRPESAFLDQNKTENSQTQSDTERTPFMSKLPSKAYGSIGGIKALENASRSISTNIPPNLAQIDPELIKKHRFSSGQGK